ncbi:MAG TPA: hypothetical protein VNH45_10580, partial [Gaiellaceae bacterium]|nr:hypothetical protein [Gaiellaceae bacterium]
MLQRLQRQADARPLEETGRQGIEALAPLVTVRLRSSPKRKRDVASSTSAPERASAAASSWSYQGV